MGWIILRHTWDPNVSLEEIADTWRGVGFRFAERLDHTIDETSQVREKPKLMIIQAAMYNYEGDTARASEVLSQTRALVESDPDLAGEWLPTVIRVVAQ